jgi:hypothetical protein
LILEVREPLLLAGVIRRELLCPVEMLLEAALSAIQGLEEILLADNGEAPLSSLDIEQALEQLVSFDDDLVGMAVPPARLGEV